MSHNNCHYRIIFSLLYNTYLLLNFNDLNIVIENNTLLVEIINYYYFLLYILYHKSLVNICFFVVEELK